MARYKFKIYCSVLVLSWALGSNLCAAQDAGEEETNPAEIALSQQDSVSTEQPTRPNINPYDRDIAMTVPLHFNNRVLGELEVILTRDDRFLVFNKNFQAQISQLLTPEAQSILAEKLGDKETFTSEDINESGIALNYDPDLLAVLVLRIDPSMRAVEDLYGDINAESKGEAPQAFSAYINGGISMSKRYDVSNMPDPSVNLMGAFRYKSLVFEAEFNGGPSFSGDEYEVERLYARLVYDQPEDYRRWWLGDIDPEYRGRQGYIDMGGIGVARQRKRFDTFRRSVLSGDRKIILQEDATIRVKRNGMFMREFKLDAGQYDLSNLPLEFGSNNIQIEVVGLNGRIQNYNYSTYLDPIDLEPGDYEYGAFIGKTNTKFFGSPSYTEGEWVFTGYWQKAFEARPALGFGFQASEDVQLLTGQTQFLLPKGTRLRFDAGVSNAPVGSGYSGMVIFEQLLERGERIDSWTVGVDYVSEQYASIGNLTPNNTNEWSFSTSYSRQLNVDWGITIGGSYSISRYDNERNSYGIFAYTNRQISRTVGVQLGAVYTDYGSAVLDPEWNFTIGLVWQPLGDRRVEARYSSKDNTADIQYSKISSNEVRSLGYSVGANYSDGPVSLNGQANYTGNRFVAGLSHSLYGQSFSKVTDVNVTSAYASSALAFVGGKFAFSRPIYDSFALVQAHDSLRGRKTIIGESFERGNYMGRSGALGPAVANSLSSYTNQTLYYDVIDVPPGYDVGEGVKRVHPTYRSGYLITAGSDAFVSVMGRLVGRSGNPVGLMSGRLHELSDEGKEPELFFTNSVGRFAAQKLKPGRTYLVELFSSPIERFEFTIPEDNEGLYDLQTVRLSIIDPEQ